MAPKQNDKQARQARERLRAYNARVTVHNRGQKRRHRDNLIAAIALVVILVVAVSAQLMFFGGPGKAGSKAAASSSATPSATPTLPPSTLAAGRTWTGTMTINGIALNFELDGKDAPQAVSSTIELIKDGFYTGNVCHRLTTAKSFKVLQCGDPNGADKAKAGQGGPGYSYGPIENAPKNNVYPAGTLAMARQSDNASSQGSQFFLVYGDTTIPSDTAGGYTVIGKVTSSLSQLEKKITDAGVSGGGSDGTPAVTPKIESITIK